MAVPPNNGFERPVTPYAQPRARPLNASVIPLRNHGVRISLAESCLTI